MLAALLFASQQVGAPATLAAEAEIWSVDHLEAPDGAVLEVGGMDFLPDGRLVVSTRRGQVWLIENALAKDPKDARFQLFAEGLQEGLGLKVVDGVIYVVQRSELSRLIDQDGDGVCDRIETVCNRWGVSGNYHEFAFGLPRDTAGNFYVSLNVAFTEPKWWHGRSLAPWRGWVLQIANDGTMTPFASGFRSPCGIGTNDQGELFVTDNQGDWEPVCPLYHVQQGRFYGAPASLVWTDEYQKTKTEPSLTNPPDRERAAPALWIPYKWSRSTGDMRSFPADGSFGPFQGELALAELTNGLTLRVDLERVRGEYQGACWILRQKVGSAVRVLFAKDGTMLCGLTNRGWGGLAPGQGIARVRWTGKVPFEVQHVHLLQNGFELTFTEPVGGEVSQANVDLAQYHYDYWWEYGSPERGMHAVNVVALARTSDPRKLQIVAPELAAGEMARCILKGLVSASGQALLHDEFHYAINQFPEGSLAHVAGDVRALCTTPIARVVPPPAARETDEEGWLRLCYGEAFDLWNAQGWKLCDVDLDGNDPTKLVVRDGNAALVNLGAGKPGDFSSKPLFGDGKYHFEFWLPKGGATALYVQGRYGIRVCDPLDEKTLTDKSCGAVIGGANFAGKAPALACFKGPGQWHELTVYFRAPRFDASGKKTENARFESVFVDDILLQQAFELPGPSQGGLAGEVAEGPLVVHGELGPCAVGGIRVKPVFANEKQGWKALFDDEELAGWKALGGEWKREEGVLHSSGKHGLLISARADLANFEVRARCKISDGSSSAMWLRASPNADGEKDPAGYAVRINATHPDKEKTGTIAGLAPRIVGLVAADTWFDLRVRCKDEAAGTRISVWINGVLINEALDVQHLWKSGALALEQHHEGSVLDVKELELRELVK